MNEENRSEELSTYMEVVEVASIPLPQVVEPKKKSKVQLLLGSENTLMP